MLRRRNNLDSRFFVGVAIIILLCLLSAAYSGITGKPSPVTNIIGAVVTPVQRLATGVSHFFGKGLSYFTEFDNLKAENEKLHKQVRDMEDTVREAQLALEENNRLRQQLGQPQRARNFTTITAEVIARNPGDWSVTLSLDKGTSHGVNVGNLVVTEDGVVGYVSHAASNYCEIVTVIDVEMQCGALITRTRESAIAEGNYDLMAEGNLRLSYLKEGVDIIVGDTVETSGRGGLFPKGVMIGTIETILPEENGISMYAVIKPFVNVETVTNVSIITAYQDSTDIAGNTGTQGNDTTSDGDSPTVTQPENNDDYHDSDDDNDDDDDDDME